MALHKDSYLTTGQAAALCQLGRETMRQYIIRGHLLAETLPSGVRRIRVLDLQRFMLAHRMTVPFALVSDT
ncbi:MAG: DNA-binding protein [Deltaproteobacteria bacterium]|nr:MAG: DNA-binding protein [Deltaproteobacteria bacterium]